MTELNGFFFVEDDDYARFFYSWVNLIMKCIPNVSYRIKANEELTDEILATRGLRQGDIHYLHICS